MTRRRDIYIAAVVLAALAAIGLAAIETSEGIHPDRRALAALLAGLLMISELQPLAWTNRRHHQGVFTVSWAFAAALALITPAAFALAALVIASSVADVAQRKPALKVAFNASALALSLGAGIAVLDLFDYRFTLVEGGAVPAGWLPVACLAGLAIFATNVLLTTVVIALDQGAPVRSLLRSALLPRAVDDVLLLALAPVLTVAGDTSLALVPLPVVAVYAVHRSARLALSSHHDALHDQLTGLPNRRRFLDDVNAVAQTEPCAVFLVDLDGFKEVNDRLGHHVGDRVLANLAHKLERSVQRGDVVARLGGDEFGVLVHTTTDASAAALARVLSTTISEPVTIDGVPVQIGASIGVAVAPRHGTDAQALLDRADAAMYTAKRRRTEVAVHDGSLEAAPDSRLVLLRELGDAVAREQLEVHFQPIIEIRSGAVCGFEALVRWNHPRLGPISPLQFISAAERTDLLLPLTELVLAAATGACAGWRASGFDVAVAVNASASSIADRRFASLVGAALKKSGLPPAALEIEITETALLVDPERAFGMLHELDRLGVALVIDDFGTGFSSLDHLRSLPVGAVKIDTSFVAELADDRLGDRFVGPVVTLAHNFGLTVVAEGVEDERTLRRLAELGCDRAQGWEVARPMPLAAATAWLIEAGGPRTPDDPVAVDPVAAS